MKDIPVFTTENGVAGLTLKEIPYTQCAYVSVHSSDASAAFFQECTDFCRAVGAQKVFARGHNDLTAYPYYTAVVSMVCAYADLPTTDAAIFPMTVETSERWREIYNEAMRNVPIASYMTQKDVQSILGQGNGYFVHQNGTLLGIGVAAGEQIDVIAAVTPGTGTNVFLALCRALSGDRICVEVATENKRAMRFYEKLGFVPTAEVTRWYQIF